MFKKISQSSVFCINWNAWYIPCEKCHSVNDHCVRGQQNEGEAYLQARKVALETDIKLDQCVWECLFPFPSSQPPTFISSWLIWEDGQPRNKLSKHPQLHYFCFVSEDVHILAQVIAIYFLYTLYVVNLIPFHPKRY